MAQNPPANHPRIVPMLAYADASAAIDFLCKAFGFVQNMRLDMPDGRIGHAELSYGGAVVSLASVYPEIGMASPKDLPALHGQVQCYVDDVDAHHAQAKAAGATIAAPPEDQFYGDRVYRAIDPEGHRWIFATHVRDVAVEDMKPPE